MKYIQWLLSKTDFQELSKEYTKTLFQRWLQEENQDILKIVKEIEAGVKTTGDEYSKILTKTYDKALIENMLVSQEEILDAIKKVDKNLKISIKKAYKNIYKFHKRTIPRNLKPKQTSKWLFCAREFRAISKVWLYIPGGTAPLFSTVLMLGIPAKLANCEAIILCTPPRSDGSIAPEILFTANLIWISKIYKIGWAQAIFSMTYGTQSISKVDKIFWPWNAFVTQAKMLVSWSVAIDMPAGPSEVLVIADKDSNASFVASDLLSQAEHGADSQAVLVCDNEHTIQEILSELALQLEKLPRKEICKKALENSFCILTSSSQESIQVSNEYAPEHLILQISNYQDVIWDIQNAGSVFLWPYSCESAWDYASGTNHTLPTSSFARSYSGVSVESFWKWITFQEITQDWVLSLWKVVENMAEAEWLDAHKNAMTKRINEI